MNTYYFTYGTDLEFPFIGGWTEVVAPDLESAKLLFRSVHPNRDGAEVLNCAFCYTEEQFKTTIMCEHNNNLGHGCWERLSVLQETFL